MLLQLLVLRLFILNINSSTCLKMFIIGTIGTTVTIVDSRYL